MLLSALVFPAVILYGCGVARGVTANDLDWRPPKLSEGQCPDLNGNYSYEITRTSNGGYITNLLPIYAGSIYVLWKTARIDPATGRLQQQLAPDQVPDFQSYYLEAPRKSNEGSDNDILHIEQTKDMLIQGDVDKTRTVTRLDTEMAGCANGALILRNLELNGGPDFTPRTVSYGELEIRKDVDGALKVTQRKRQKSISLSSGVLGDRKEMPSVTRIYPPAKL